MKRFAVVTLAAAILAFGCSTIPQVRYQEKDNINENYIPVALLGSRVVITKPDETKKDDTVEKKIAALGLTKASLVSEAELKNQKIVIAPTQAKSTVRYVDTKQGLLQKTNLSVTYFDGLKVPKTVGIEVQNDTLKLIQALGAVGVTIGTLVALKAPAAEAGKMTLPIVIDFSDPSAFTKDRSEACHPLEKPNEKYCFSYELVPKEGREVITSIDFYKLYTDHYTNKFPFSRCVDLILKIKKWDAHKKKEIGEIATFNAIIADPFHVDWLPMPVKGSISLQSVCGADSKTEKSENTGAYDIMEAVGKQVDAIWKAWHPK